MRLGDSMNSIQGAVHARYTDEDLRWSPRENAAAGKAFDLALHREFAAVIAETKSRAAAIEQVSDVRDLEWYLTKRRRQIDRQFDYRYSVLIQVFGDLLHKGKLAEAHLSGLGEDKLASIRSYAPFLASPMLGNRG